MPQDPRQEGIGDKTRDEYWRWVVRRDSRYWRILHKFRIKRDEKISKNGRLWRRGHRKLEDSWEDNVPRTQHDGRHKGDELWDHSSEIPFGIHHSHGNNRDE